MSVPRPAGVPDPVRFCVLTTVALLAWLLGPPAVVVAMSLLGLWAYRRAMRAGLTESRCVLKRPWLVLAYLALALLGGVAGVMASLTKLHAQPAAAPSPELRGTVRDSTSRRAIAGAVVLLVNADDSVLARGISNERGLYHVPLAPDARRLRIRRIGFQPRIIALPASGVASVDVAMLALPTMLSGVRVTDGARCSRRGDRAAALALWEQARDALLAAVVARETAPAQMVRLRYDRRLDGDRVTGQSVRSDTTERGARSFVAVRSGADFVQRGFVDFGDDGATFYAPDADVLLDASFANGYCLHVTGDARRPNDVGLGFEPARRQRGRVDITGALWIDTVARALHDVEFRYAGLDRSFDAVRPGGRVSFRALENGVVLVDRWSMRIATVRADTAYPRGSPVIRSWLDAREIGGEVARARWPDGYAWQSDLAVLRLQAATHDGAPAAGTVIHLADTDYQAVVDGAGRAEIVDLLPGPYAVEIVDPMMAMLQAAIPTRLRIAAERATVVERRLEVPTLEDFTAEACGTANRLSRAATDTAWVLARVMSGDGSPVDRVHWTIAHMRRADWSVVAEGTTGTNGFFQLCKGLMPNERVRIEVRRAGPPIAVELLLQRKLTVVPLPLPAVSRDS